MFAGPFAWDVSDVDVYAKRYNASVVGAMAVAERLVSGDIIGVIRGRAEFGPRALGLIFPRTLFECHLG